MSLGVSISTTLNSALFYRLTHTLTFNINGATPLYRMTFCILTLIIMSLIVMTFCIMTLVIMALIVMTLCLMKLS
jgi:hypothetical protein